MDTVVDKRLLPLNTCNSYFKPNNFTYFVVYAFHSIIYQI